VWIDTLDEFSEARFQPKLASRDSHNRMDHGCRVSHHGVDIDHDNPHRFETSLAIA
jgi:hypothetical protein